MKWKIFAICLRLSRACRSFIHWILATFLDSLESCMFIQLCSLTFFSFSAYAEVWRVRLDWTLRRRLSLAWRSHIWFHSLTQCELDLLVNQTSRSWITCISLSFEHLIACNESQLCHSVFWSIKNMLYTLHVTYIKHDLYADFLLRLKKLLREFSYDRFTVQDEWNLSLLKFQQFTS